MDTSRHRDDRSRTHQQLGLELDLFHVPPDAVGVATWHPRGLAIYRALEQLISQTCSRHGYQEVSTPIVWSESLWRISGHLDRYRDRMLHLAGHDAAIKPMNCPGHAEHYAHRRRSYRELPFRLAELGRVHRDELSGAVTGLLRTRAFTIDDGHIFAREDQVSGELSRCLSLARRLYSEFEMRTTAELSLRPDQRLGHDQLWDRAEAALREALAGSEIPFIERPGEGAFYGPKVDLHAVDSRGRPWQLGSVQLDYLLARRFGLHYVDADDQERTPVIIHRALLGSIERFLAVLLEHTQGRLPVWLAPEQLRILPVGSRQRTHATSLCRQLELRGLRAVVHSDGTLSARIRAAHAAAVPLVAVIGDRELADATLTVRSRDGERTLPYGRVLEDIEGSAGPPRI